MQLGDSSMKKSIMLNIFINLTVLLFVFTIALANSIEDSTSATLLTSEQVFKLLFLVSLMSTSILFLFMIIERVLIIYFKPVTDESTLPVVIEGITVILIIIAVTVLRLSSSISSEGTVSIFSAIVGYVLGKIRGKQAQTLHQEETNNA